MARVPIEHLDMISQNLTVGCNVVTRYFGNLVIGTVCHTTKSYAKIKIYDRKKERWNPSTREFEYTELILNRRPHEAVVIDSPEVALYALKYC